MKRRAGVGGARVPTEVQTRVDEWVAERVAEPLTRRGYKADPLIVVDECGEPPEGAAKGKAAVKAEGKPAKPPT